LFKKIKKILSGSNNSEKGKAEGLDLSKNLRGFDFLSIKKFDTI
jgi:hypothetical protein